MSTRPLWNGLPKVGKVVLSAMMPALRLTAQLVYDSESIPKIPYGYSNNLYYSIAWRSSRKVDHTIPPIILTGTVSACQGGFKVEKG